MGYMTAPPALVDLDGDGDIDGILRRIKDGTGITLSLSQNILTIGTSGGINLFTDGAPSNDDGENGDLNVDYTNGDIYRKAGGSWTLFDEIPSFRRMRMTVLTYNTSTWAGGKFGVYSDKYYFHKTAFPGTSTVAEAETYLTNLGITVGTRFIFQQVDNHDNIAVYKVADSTLYSNGESGYESGTVGADHVGIVLSKESGVSFSADAQYNISSTMPLNFIFDSSGNATISADLTIKEMILTTASGSTSSTSTTTIDEWAIATYRSAKYEYSIKNADEDEYQVGEMLAVHDGTNAKHSDYSVIFTGSSPLGTFSTDVSGGNCRLRFTATNSDAMTVKIARKAIKV